MYAIHPVDENADPEIPTFYAEVQFLAQLKSLVVLAPEVAVGGYVRGDVEVTVHETAQRAQEVKGGKSQARLFEGERDVVLVPRGQPRAYPHLVEPGEDRHVPQQFVFVGRRCAFYEALHPLGKDQAAEDTGGPSLLAIFQGRAGEPEGSVDDLADRAVLAARFAFTSGEGLEEHFAVCDPGQHGERGSSVDAAVVVGAAGPGDSSVIRYAEAAAERHLTEIEGADALRGLPAEPILGAGA